MNLAMMKKQDQIVNDIFHKNYHH